MRGTTPGPRRAAVARAFTILTALAPCRGPYRRTLTVVLEVSTIAHTPQTVPLMCWDHRPAITERNTRIHDGHKSSQSRQKYKNCATLYIWLLGSSARVAATVSPSPSLPSDPFPIADYQTGLSVHPRCSFSDPQIVTSHPWVSKPATVAQLI